MRLARWPAARLPLLLLLLLGGACAPCRGQTAGGFVPGEVVEQEEGAVSAEDAVGFLTSDQYAQLLDNATEEGPAQREYICPYDCVEPNKLVWCADAVTYTYCNRMVPGEDGDLFASRMYMEDAAIKAYRAIIREIPGGEDRSDCKAAMRKWMCYTFFQKCANDLERYYPVCASACENAKVACGNPVWIDCEEGFLEGACGFKARMLCSLRSPVRLLCDACAPDPSFITLLHQATRCLRRMSSCARALRRRGERIARGSPRQLESS